MNRGDNRWFLNMEWKVGNFLFPLFFLISSCLVWGCDSRHWSSPFWPWTIRHVLGMTGQENGDCLSQGRFSVSHEMHHLHSNYCQLITLWFCVFTELFRSSVNWPTQCIFQSLSNCFFLFFSPTIHTDCSLPSLPFSKPLRLPLPQINCPSISP